MRDDVTRDWDEIDAEAERIFRRPKPDGTRQDRAREAFENLFTRKPVNDKGLQQNGGF